jgi:transposase
VDRATVNLIARVFAVCEGVRSGGRGRPLADLVRVLATFRRFLREGTPWRSLRASETQASGATLRRRLAEWARTDLLWQGHVTLVGLLRGRHPDLILDSCSVRAKRGGDLTGRNPTDRGKRGTKYHIAVDGRGVRLRTVFADKGYDAAANRDLCRRSGVAPCIHTRGQPHGSGLGQRRWPVERSLAWVLENKRLDRRYDRKGVIVEALLRGACILTAASKLIQEFIEETATKART